MKETRTSPSSDGARTTLLDRVETVLGAFGSSSRLTGGEIMGSTRLPRTSTYRILEQLVGIGWLEREGNTHRLGTRLMELGSIALDQDPLAHAAEPHLIRLHRTTGLVVHLAVLDGTDVVYLRKVGDTLTRLSPVRTGFREPAEGSLLGGALLARADTGDHVPLGTAPEIHSGDGELACIAARVSPRGGAKAAVSVCGPSRLAPLPAQAGTAVRETAAAILRDLHRPGLRSRDPRPPRSTDRATNHSRPR